MAPKLSLSDKGGSYQLGLLGSQSASISTFPKVVPIPLTCRSTSAVAVDHRVTELKRVFTQRAQTPLTPYKADVWEAMLSESGLAVKYPDLVSSLRHGFRVGIRSISATFIPPNKPSIEKFATEFDALMEKEFTTGRYLGPMSQHELEQLIGPFQTSPLSLIPKPHKPNSFRMVQDLSFPHSPHSITQSINSTIESSEYPCTYGTFAAVCLLIHQLPPGSEVACRDVVEAYRGIPLHHSQWPGAAVRLRGNDSFGLDTCLMFGITSGGGIHGLLDDGGVDIFRWKGMGPISKWSDDHFFTRIRREHLVEFNERRAATHQRIRSIGGRQTHGGRLWFAGGVLPSDFLEEFDEDYTFPVADLSQYSPRSEHDREFSYSFEDIDKLSDALGFIWGKDKDSPFAPSCPFTGFLWNVQDRTVALAAKKAAKYQNAIFEWQKSRTHTLEETQSLYGKLLHTSLIVPEGRAYLTNLEAFMGVASHNPFVPLTPPRDTPSDIKWWSHTLTKSSLQRRLPVPSEVVDLHAFSDASSGFGIAIVIRGKWRAWKLIEGWNTEGRTIAWAEAIGFYLLVRAILDARAHSIHVKLYGDNNGVVEGWWAGRSRDKRVNEVFRLIHQLLGPVDVTVHSRYVPSKKNPADGPSRGIYASESLLLPPITIPTFLKPFVIDVNQDTSSGGFQHVPKSIPESEFNRRQQLNYSFEQHGNELINSSLYWWD
jgi:hypothetical protein